eukprot:COSAG01_NODE_11942_length_1829_cov_168.017341_3_plen_98_part_00
MISTMAGIPGGARSRVVAEALIRNLHRFVKDVEPTNEEWESAMAFLVKLGQVGVWLVTVVVLVGARDDSDYDGDMMCVCSPLLAPRSFPHSALLWTR